MNQALLERLKASPQLPSLPAIALKALELARKDNVDISEIADLISNDPALSSKILKTVNSSFYGLPKQVSTISHALVILGLQAVKTLALGFSLLGNLRGPSPGNFDYIAFWKRSIYSAVAGRTLARKLNVLQQEEAFLAGLLADIGTLVMHRVMGSEFDMLLAQDLEDETMLQVCRQKFDLDHTDVAGMLAEHWKLPPVLAAPVRHHHNPQGGQLVDPQLKPLVEVVYVAMICGEVFANSDPAKYIVRARAEMAQRFKLSPEQIEATLSQIGTSTREAARLFEVQLPDSRSYEDILSEAQQAMLELTLQSQQQVQVIRKENESLAQKATTDLLTGLANRAKFDEFFADQFTRAYKLQRPLAILFIDVDHFKKVNDTFGHQAGDEVLKRLGRLLKMAARNIDLAARYGGEEFALVLTETESSAAAQMADELRQAVAAERIAFENQTIKVTISVGVAGTDRSRVFQGATQLANAADRAVYAAKSAGRNCVRLFRPRVAEPASR